MPNISLQFDVGLGKEKTMLRHLGVLGRPNKAARISLRPVLRNNEFVCSFLHVWLQGTGSKNAEQLEEKKNNCYYFKVCSVFIDSCFFLFLISQELRGFLVVLFVFMVLIVARMSPTAN